jgi:hypothetical protein
MGSPRLLAGPVAVQGRLDKAYPDKPGFASSQAGDWHDTSGHHRYYGSSATNGGERIIESRQGARPHSVNLCGF